MTPRSTCVPLRAAGVPRPGLAARPNLPAVARAGPCDPPSLLLTSAAASRGLVGWDLDRVHSWWVVHRLTQPHKRHDLAYLPEQGNRQDGEPKSGAVQPVDTRESENHHAEKDDLPEVDGQSSGQHRQRV